jgi:hypothetical protein
VIQKDSAGEIEESAKNRDIQQQIQTFRTKDSAFSSSATLAAVCIISFDAKEAVGVAKNTTISTP